MENGVENNSPLQENVAKQTTTTTAEKKGFSIASMVLGIIALIRVHVWYIAIPCSILAIVFSIVGKKKGGRGMATAGLVLGIIAIVLTAIIYIIGAILIVNLIIEVFTSYR